jgi:mono/diheme cytochrome c family protein
MPLPRRLIGLAVTAMLVAAPDGLAAAAEPDGDALYAQRCAGCHGKNGALKILRQRSPEARKRAYNGSHLRYHLHDEAERAAVVAHLKRMMRE